MIEMQEVSASSCRERRKQPPSGDCFSGGDKRDRTADLLNAIQALSQLSYTPISVSECNISRSIMKSQHLFSNRKSPFPTACKATETGLFPRHMIQCQRPSFFALRMAAAVLTTHIATKARARALPTFFAASSFPSPKIRPVRPLISERKEAHNFPIDSMPDLLYSASSQLCQTFWTSSLSSNMSSIFCMFLTSSSFVSLI